MAFLSKAKESVVDEKNSDDNKKKKNKKRKHPSAPQPSGPEEGPAGDSDGAEDEQEPQPEAGDAEGQDESDGSDAGSEPPAQPQEGGGQEDQGGADAGADPSAGGQPAQQGQGASPVPNPAAPGAGDTTSGGEDTPPQGEGDTGGEETPGEDTQAGPGSEDELPQVPMSKGLQEEYERVNEAIMQAIYGPGQVGHSVVQALQPQGGAKIRSAATMALVIMKSIYTKTRFPIQLVMPVTKDIVAHIMDVGQQVKQIQYSDQESVAILGAAYEGAMRIFGVNHGQVKNLAHHLGRKALTAHAQKYQQAHAFAKQAIDANHASDEQGAPAGAPQEAGPQTGAPAGAQSTPVAGASPQPQGPPPATLSQGAAAAGMADQGGGQ